MHEHENRHRRGAGHALFVLIVVALGAAAAIKWAWREIAVGAFAAPEISFIEIVSAETALILFIVLIGAAFAVRRGRGHVDPR